VASVAPGAALDRRVKGASRGCAPVRRRRMYRGACGSRGFARAIRFAALYTAPDASIVHMVGEPSYARASEGEEGEEGDSRRVREGHAATRKLLALLRRPS
jgi:hypothetical protein